jgi:hypothetical protein
MTFIAVQTASRETLPGVYRLQGQHRSLRDSKSQPAESLGQDDQEGEGILK